MSFLLFIQRVFLLGSSVILRKRLVHGSDFDGILHLSVSWIFAKMLVAGAMMHVMMPTALC